MKNEIILGANLYLHDDNINDLIKKIFNVTFVLGRENELIKIYK